ncbi:MAG: metallophosphoesterase [Acidobacteria bacterium]|nr:MAG: metallophosphoesterase [Acidobacteriota bacterium]
MRIAAIADFHCRVNSTIAPLLDGVQDQADLLLLAGDLTDTGLPAEMAVLLNELKQLSLPILAILGNHDHENDHSDELCTMLADTGIMVLEGNVVEVQGIGFLGAKGFCGGFDDKLVQPFGERAIKDFIRIGIDESVRLENSVAKLQTPKKVAVLHYSPVKQTLEGESPELFPFLGSSRLASALDRHGVDVIVHGHAHHGSPEGRTAGGIPVYNVCRFVQQRCCNRPYLVFQV